MKQTTMLIRNADQEGAQGASEGAEATKEVAISNLEVKVDPERVARLNELLKKVSSFKRKYSMKKIEG